MRVVLFTVLCLLSCACTYTKIEGEHISHPFAGPPFGDKSEEDSLNQVNGCAGTERMRWYTELCVGYVIGNGGFVGPRLTTTVRAGFRPWVRQ